MSLYEVEDIISHRINKYKKKEYLIKWAGYGLNQSTWEPIKNLLSVKNMIERYQKNIKQQQNNLLKIHKKCIKMVKTPQHQQYLQDPASEQIHQKQANQLNDNLPSVSSFSQISDQSQNSQVYKPNQNSDSDEESSFFQVKSFLPLQYDLDQDQKKIKKKAYKFPKNGRRLKYPIKIIGLWLDQKDRKHYIIKYRQDITLYCYRDYIVNYYYRQLIDYLQSKVQFSKGNNQ